MARVETIEGAKVVREYVSPVTTVHWDAVTNTGVIVYNINELLFINGEFISSTQHTTVSLPLEEMISKSYDIEVAAGVFQTVQGGLIMLAFKKAFEQAIEEGRIIVGTAPVKETAP